MTVWIVYVLMSVATFRLTRLIVRDDFPPILWVRQKIQRARPTVRVYEPVEGSSEYTVRWWWLGELVSCHWCASGWVALGVTVGTWFAVPTLGGLQLLWLWWLAVWGAGAVLADRLS